MTNEPAQKLLYTLGCEIKSLLTCALRENFVNKVGNECVLSGHIEFGELLKKHLKKSSIMKERIKEETTSMSGILLPTLHS